MASEQTLTLEKVLDDPRGGSFAQGVFAVFELHDLPLSQIDAYLGRFQARYTALHKELTWCSAFTLFDAVNGWTLHDIFGLDFAGDQTLIRNVRNDLWLTLTGENPT